MSATAFQRRRRELEQTKDIKEAEIIEKNKVPEDDKEVQEENKTLENLTLKELKDLLDGKSIEYNSKAKKEELIKILEGAE